MLESSLQAERQKNSKTTEPPPPVEEDAEPALPQSSVPEGAPCSLTLWLSNMAVVAALTPLSQQGAMNVDKEGRHVLLQYLSEMQYTDAVIAAQAQRVRGMLDSWSPTELSRRAPQSTAPDAGGDDEDEDPENEQFDDDDGVDDFMDGMPSSVVSDLQGDGSVDGSKDISLTAVDLHAEQHIPDELPLSGADETSEKDDLELQQRILKNFSGKMSKRMGKNKSRMQAKSMFDTEPDLESKLGELSDVNVSSIAAEADGAGSQAAVSAATGEALDASVRKTWKMKMELRGHLDGVREVLFHPHEPLLVTASEDATVAVWPAAPTPQSKLVQASEPLRILRGHSGPVYAAAFTSSGVLYTGGADRSVIAWQLPSAGADRFVLLILRTEV